VTDRQIVSKPEPGVQIAEGPKGPVMALDGLQTFFDDIEQKINDLLGKAVILPIYTVATVPAAEDYTAGLIYVSDESGGAVPAFSDGSSWRRVTDRTIIS